jgi:hypothetical protein
MSFFLPRVTPGKMGPSDRTAMVRARHQGTQEAETPTSQVSNVDFASEGAQCRVKR